MQFNPTEKYARPLGGLRKPGAGQVMVTMGMAPAGARPLLLENISRAQNAVYALLGEPGATEIPKTGMITEYNVLLINRNYLYGEYDPAGNAAARISLLATIVALTQGAWVDLVEFLLDAQGVVMARVANLLDERTPPEYRETATAHLQYYADQITALDPQISDIAAQLELAGELSVEKLEAFKIDFQASRSSLLATLKAGANALADSAQAAADALAEAAKALEKAQKRLVWAIAGIAVVALVGAAIYFIPRPRRR